MLELRRLGERPLTRLPHAGPARITDGAFMEPSGRNRWQPVANGAAAKTAQTVEPLPWVATGCRVNAIVRRGSTVRVRQRALTKAPQPGGFRSSSGQRDTAQVTRVAHASARAFRIAWSTEIRSAPSSSSKTFSKSLAILRGGLTRRPSVVARGSAAALSLSLPVSPVPPQWQPTAPIRSAAG